jgi:hypothetical protein
VVARTDAATGRIEALATIGSAGLHGVPQGQHGARARGQSPQPFWQSAPR